MTLVKARLILGTLLLGGLLVALSATGVLGAAWRSFDDAEPDEPAPVAAVPTADPESIEALGDLGPAQANEYVARFTDRAFLLRITPDGRGGYTGVMFWAYPGDAPGSFRRARYGVALAQLVERPGAYALSLSGQLLDARFSGDLLVVQMPALQTAAGGTTPRTYTATFAPGTHGEFDDAARRAEQLVRSRTATPAR